MTSQPVSTDQTTSTFARSLRTDWRWTATIASGVAFTVVALFGPWPLGVAGEWTWSELPASAVSLIVGLLIGLLGAAYLTAVHHLTSRYETATSRGRMLLAVVLAILGFGFATWARAPVDWLDTAAGRSRDPWVLYSPGASGYFTEARLISSTSDFLANYEATVAQGDYLHQGTHPPGLIVLYRGLFTACRAFPVLVSGAEAFASAPVRESLVVLSETQQPTPNRVDLAVLWWAGVLTQAVYVLSVWPLLGLIRRASDPATAWRLASLWPLIPAGLVFLPKSDCLYPCCVLTTCWCWTRTLEGSWIGAAFAGILGSLSLTLSLALAPVYAGIGLGSLVAAKQSETLTWSRLGNRTSVAIATGLVPLAGAAVLDLNLVNVWIGNLQNHASFYDHNQRTFLAWLAVNFVEGVLAGGAPIVFTACLVTFLRDTEARRIVSSISAGVLVAWLALWLSGKNMGEAARLWVLLTPFPSIWIASQSRVTPTRWRLLASASLLVCVFTLIRVSGFELSPS